LTGEVARLFIAVWPPAEVARQLTAMHRHDQRQVQRGVRFVRPENWHITLRFVGDADPDAVVDVLDGTAFASARARLGPAVEVMGGHAIVVPVHGLDTLARQVAERTGQIGEPPGRQFVGHLTLARVKPDAAMPQVVGFSLSAEFDVEEIALVESRLEPQGVQYETIERWLVG
jgi:RNA 2',3'-cyclic 3'-phosphodiesterase